MLFFDGPLFALMTRLFLSENLSTIGIVAGKGHSLKKLSFPGAHLVDAVLEGLLDPELILELVEMLLPWTHRPEMYDLSTLVDAVPILNRLLHERPSRQPHLQQPISVLEPSFRSLLSSPRSVTGSDSQRLRHQRRYMTRRYVTVTLLIQDTASRNSRPVRAMASANLRSVASADWSSFQFGFN